MKNVEKYEYLSLVQNKQHLNYHYWYFESEERQRRVHWKYIFMQMKFSTKEEVDS